MFMDSNQFFRGNFAGNEEAGKLVCYFLKTCMFKKIDCFKFLLLTSSYGSLAVVT